MEEKIKKKPKKLDPLQTRMSQQNSQVFKNNRVKKEDENVQLNISSGIQKETSKYDQENQKNTPNSNQIESLIINDQKKKTLNNTDQKSEMTDIRHYNYLLKFIFLPFSMIISNLFLVINLIAFNYYDQGMLDTYYYNFFFRMDLFVGIMIIIEYGYKNFLTSFAENVSVKSRILDFINIFEIFWFQLGLSKINILIVMRAFRSFKMKSIRNYFVLLKFYVRKLVALKKDDEMYYQVIDFKDDKFHSFLIDSFINLSSGILIQSSFILAMDQIYEYKSFYQDNQDQYLTYVGAAYFVIISFSTIGYGDIFPIITQSRLAISVLLIFNITIMSNFLSQFIEYLYDLSQFEMTYDFTGHVVIIGHIPEAYFGRFLSELIELDNIQRVLGQETSKDGIKVILVGKDEPSMDIQTLTTFYSENAMFSNEVVYLKADIFSENVSWHKQANIKNCRALFAFSQRVTDRPQQEDMELALVTRQIKQVFSMVPCYLVLQSQYKEILVKDSLFDQVNIISTTECNESILGFSVENTGFSTILQHLISIKNKQIPNSMKQEAEFDPFQKQYIRDMEQEIYTIPLGPQFQGMTFQQLAKLFYFSGFDFIQKLDFFCGNEDFKEVQTLATLIAIQTEGDSYKQVKLKKSMSKLYQEDNIRQKKKILINPQGYKIKLGDIAYIICEDFKEVIKCKNISKNSEYYPQYERNIKQLNSMLQKQKNQEILQQWWQQEKKRKEEETKISLDSAEGIIQKSDSDECLRKGSLKSQTQQNVKRIYNFHFLEYPEIQLRNHIVIIGTLQSFIRMVEKLHDNVYNQKVIVLFTEEKLDLFKWNKLCEDYKYLYFFNGDFHNLNHLMQLSLPYSYQILILSSANDKLFQDSSAISLARMIQNYFDQSKLLVELKDDRRIFYFAKNPIFAQINENVTPFIWPAFQQGSIHLSSCLYGLLARSIYDQNWLPFFEQLINDQHEIDQTKNCNQKIGCYKVNEEIANYCNYFENTPSVIGLGLIKFQLTSKHKKTLLEQIMKQTSLQTQKIDSNQRASSVYPMSSQYSNNFENDQVFNSSQQFLSVANKLFGNRFVFTNPSFYTPIEEGDLVLVLGQINQEKMNNLIKSQTQDKVVINESPDDSRMSPLQLQNQASNIESFEKHRNTFFSSQIQIKQFSSEKFLKLKNVPELSDFGLESFINNQQYESLLEQNILMQNIHESRNSPLNQIMKKRTYSTNTESPDQKKIVLTKKMSGEKRMIDPQAPISEKDEDKIDRIKSSKSFKNLENKQMLKNIVITHLQEQIEFHKKIQKYNEQFQNFEPVKDHN